MSLARVYKAGVFDTSTPLIAGAPVAGVTTPVPILYGVTSATADCNIACLRIGVLGATAFPATQSMTFSLNVVTGSKAGGQAVVAKQLSGVTLAAQTVWSTAGGTGAAAITGLTMGAVLWSQPLPFTGGSNWEDYLAGLEINIPASTQFALFATCSAAGTATSASGEAVFTE
jgi:hypothetical protein